MSAPTSLRRFVPKASANEAPHVETPAPGQSRSRNVRLALIATLLLALHWTPLAGLNFIFSLLALALLLPAEWSLVRRMATAYPLFGLLSALVGHASYFLGFTYVVWPVTALAFVCFIAFRAAAVPLRPLVSASDAIPIALALFALCLMAPTLVAYNFGGHIPIVAFGEDAISHFAIFENMLEQRTLLFGRTDILSQILRELANYPQSSHLHAVTAYAYLLGGAPTNPGTLISFFSAFQIALTALLLLQLGYLFTESTTAPRIAQLFGALVVGLLGAGFVIGYLNLYGFYSQIAAYVTLVTLLHLLLAAEQHPSTKTLSCAILVESGVAATWFFLSPVSYALLLCWAIRNRGRYPFKRFAALLALNAALNAFFVYLPYVNLDPIRYLNFSGAVDPLPLWLFILTGIGSTGYFLSKRGESERGVNFLLVSLFAVSALFAAAVYVYQLITHGSITYYFHKSLYTTALPLLIASACGIAALAATVFTQTHNTPERRAGLLALLAAALCFGLYQLSAPVLDRFLVERPTFLKRDVYAEMLQLREVPGITRRVIFPIGKEPYETHVMTRWLPSIVGSPIWREHYRSPLAYLAGYQAEVARYVATTRFKRRPVIFDPRGALRAECNREFFQLRRKKRLAILPKQSAAWDLERCGAL